MTPFVRALYLQDVLRDDVAPLWLLCCTRRRLEEVVEPRQELAARPVDDAVEHLLAELVAASRADARAHLAVHDAQERRLSHVRPLELHEEQSDRLRRERAVRRVA